MKPKRISARKRRSGRLYRKAGQGFYADILVRLEKAGLLRPAWRTPADFSSDVVRLRPDLGVIPDQVAMLRSQIGSLPTGLGGASTLTAAELRVLAYLPLYLSFKEIGQRLGVKASTVQTHAVAIYGKLGASSRSEAVDLAVAAGLLDARPTWFATSHT